MIAKQQHLIHWGANLIRRSFDEAETQIFCRVLYAVEVARDFPLRRQDDDAGSVSELIGFGIELYTGSLTQTSGA